MEKTNWKEISGQEYYSLFDRDKHEIETLGGYPPISIIRNKDTKKEELKVVEDKEAKFYKAEKWKRLI